MSELCENQVLSQLYADFIVEFGGNAEVLTDRYQTECITVFNTHLAMIHLPVDSMKNVAMFAYNSVPKVYGLMDSTNMDISGITRVHNQPYLSLRGANILVGLIDTGIDYTHPVFRYADGTTRIAAIWDQTINNGLPPRYTDYGTEYTSEDINRALASEQPETIVPSKDTNGHGTFMAGIAAGNIDPSSDFAGAAPESVIAAVKLKEAKDYLREYYVIPDGISAYQETDIMMGIRYLVDKAILLQKSLVIYIGVGTNSGGHDGSSYLGQYMNDVGDLRSVCIVAPCGNEGNRGTHYYGQITENGAYEDVEIRVDNGEAGFVVELWGKAPDILSVGIVSPGGERVEKIKPRYNLVQTIDFLLEPTEIFVMFELVESSSGNPVIVMRFRNPSPGIWTIRVYGENILYKDYHMWLPIGDFIEEGTYFLKPDPNMTVTEPGNTNLCIATTAYNHYSSSIYVQSGRGFTFDGRVVPDIAAPGVNIYGPVPGGGFTRKSGTSAAAAHTAGAAALLLEWGIYRRNNLNMDTTEVKKLMTRGARRRPGILYPSRIWGFGELDLYNVFVLD